MIKIALLAAAALASVTGSAASFAGEVSVPYGDLDLASAKGQKTLAHRIDRAAREVCELSSDGRVRSADAMRCYAQARSRAHTEMALLNDTGSNLGG